MQCWWGSPPFLLFLFSTFLELRHSLVVNNNAPDVLPIVFTLRRNKTFCEEEEEEEEKEEKEEELCVA